MMRGRKPKPTAVKSAEGNPGKRRINGREPKPPASLPASLPDCPSHLSDTAKLEWDRIAVSLNRVGLLTQVDRSTMAGYCQCYGRWVEAELRLAETPAILRMPSGYIQQSPWLTIANKQLELMARYMAELGLTPASRSRLAVQLQTGPKPWEYGGPNRIIIEAMTGTKGETELIEVTPGGIVISQNDR